MSNSESNKLLLKTPLISELRLAFLMGVYVVPGTPGANLRWTLEVLQFLAPLAPFLNTEGLHLKAESIIGTIQQGKYYSVHLFSPFHVPGLISLQLKEICSLYHS